MSLWSKIGLISLVIISGVNSDQQNSCSKEMHCSAGERLSVASALGLPGTDVEWMTTLTNMRMFSKQMWRSLQDLGFGQFMGELAEMTGLPGSKNDWMWMMKGVTLESVQDSWNEFRHKLNSGESA